ncbi:serine/threonine-protein kinase [Acidovorax cavernicola]|uniref:non-specific serine/threonine protein kinase n=1 Tax=Acidovorax cavernicola TaxID=1675792 RepID=A0A9X8GSW7_9BURK|nr:serine/threonine-protein kinase [Acidovorax cavernicola]RIX74296.1 serine/threonine protein kinase [Acidovorax cavernicola]
MTTPGSPSVTPDPQEERPHPLGTGHRLDEFELLEVIGEGGFGIVYRAYDHSLQREVAVKEYMPSMLARRVGDNSVHVRSERLTATFAAGLRSFINEARTLAQFSHPALVRVHRFWEANSTAYMAIQLYKGRTLRKLADSEPGTLTEPWLLGMLGPLLGALDTLHHSQCFHRDIAPDNIFIQQQDDRPVLLDFGAARKSIADLVDEVAVMVKSGYSPIEQYADDNTLLQGAWTDLYALGAVLYRAVTGHPPPSAVVRSVQDAYVPLSSMDRDDLSPAFCAAVDHTLAVHSKDRTQTVAAFAAELGLVKLGDIYVGRMSAPAVAVVPAVPVPAPVQEEPPAPPPVPVPPPEAALPPAAPEPVEVAAARTQTPPPVARTKKPSKRSPLFLVGALVLALFAVGGWIGWRLTAHTSADPVIAAAPPPGVPMSDPGAPPAAMPPGGAASGAAVVVPPASAPSASASAPLSPLDNVPVAAAPAPPAPSAAPAEPEAPPAQPEPVPQPPADPAAVAELEDWNLAQAENTREGYEAYLRRHRRGPHAREARNAIAQLNRQSPPPPAAGSTNPVPTVVAGAPAAPPAAAPGMGRVQFNIRPWGQVFVDGADRGVSPPLKSLSLRPGIYTIEVRNGDLTAYRQRVTVQDSKSAPVVSHEFK